MPNDTTEHEFGRCLASFSPVHSIRQSLLCLHARFIISPSSSLPLIVRSSDLPTFGSGGFRLHKVEKSKKRKTQNCRQAKPVLIYRERRSTLASHHTMSERLMKAKARHTAVHDAHDKPSQRLSTSTHSSINSQFSAYSAYPDSIYSAQSGVSTPVSHKPMVVLGDGIAVRPKETSTTLVAEIYDSYADKRLSIGSFSSSGSDMSEINNDFLLQAIRDSATEQTREKMDFHQTHQGHRQTAETEKTFTGLGYQTEIVCQDYELERTVTNVSSGSEKRGVGEKLRTFTGRFIR